MQTYVVMGAHGGTGEALSRILAAAGHDLVLTARDASKIASDIQGQKISYDVLQDRPENVFSGAGLEQGIDGFAYCIGSIDLKPFAKCSPEDYLKTYELNVLGAVKALQYLIPFLQKKNGSVVLFSTVAVAKGFSNHSLISTAKGALEALTRSLAAEYAPNIRINAIAPSLSDTPLASGMTGNAAMAQAIAKTHPMQRLGTAEDLAEMSAFLLSQKSSWITGQIIAVDGGKNALHNK